VSAYQVTQTQRPAKKKPVNELCAWALVSLVDDNPTAPAHRNCEEKYGRGVPRESRLAPANTRSEINRAPDNPDAPAREKRNRRSVRARRLGTAFDIDAIRARLERASAAGRGFLGDCGTLRPFTIARTKLPAPVATAFPYQTDDSARIRL